ncbi:EAL domain-containing protein [Thauera mechernichensis]
MQRNKRTIHIALVATVLALNLFIAGLLAYTLEVAKERKEEEVRVTVENLSLLLDQSVSSSIREIDLALREVQKHLEWSLRDEGVIDRTAMDELIDFHRDWLSAIAEVRVTNAAGEVILGHAVTPATRVSYADRSFFLEHQAGDAGRTLASTLLYGRIAGTWIVVFSRRYNDASGRFAGVVTAAVPVAFFERLLSGLRLGPNGIALVRDMDMTLIARFPTLDSPAGQVGTRGGSQELRDIVASGVGAQAFYSARTADGINRINAYRKLASMPAFVVVGWGEDDYLAQWHYDRWKAIVFFLTFCAVTLVAGGLLWRLVRATERANQRSRILLQNASDGINITDAAGTVVEASDAFCRMIGHPRADVIGMNVTQWDAGFSADGLREVTERLLESSEVLTFETVYRRRDGGTFPVEITAFALEVDGRRVLFCSARDISARKSAEAEVRQLAYYDALTGLPNRRLLLERLEAAQAASAKLGSRGALLFIDLDNFKTINDTVGHQQGDALLKEVASVLGRCVRKEDTVARLGGDEFVVMLENLDEREDAAARVAEAIGGKILQALRKTFAVGNCERRVSASIGVTLFGGEAGEALEEPLMRADLAMYQAKYAGRDAMRFFNPQMQADAQIRAELEAGLWSALEKGQFVLEYQPQVRGSAKVIGVEALVRWRHPERGLVSPAEFIPIAEENGLIVPLGRWVIETACVQLAAWASVPGRAELSIAVNVSARQFLQPDFVADVLGALERSGACAQRLEIELTESTLITDIEQIIARMEVLRAHGLRFSLDDFGTGYSSLAYLKRLPLDQVKIDRSFVRDILVDPNDAAIATMITVLGETLGLVVVAEGVETEAQRDCLLQIGCRAYQGFLFSRPLGAVQLEAFLDAMSPQAAAQSPR